MFEDLFSLVPNVYKHTRGRGLCYGTLVLCLVRKSLLLLKSKDEFLQNVLRTLELPSEFRKVLCQVSLKRSL